MTTEKWTDGTDSFIQKSLFDAHTVLIAIVDNTPIALIVGEQTVVGRLTGENITAVAIGISDNNIVQIDHASATDDDYAKFTAAGLEGRSFAEVLSDLSGQATSAFDWNNQELDNIKTLNITDGTELTISSGAVTATQGHHAIDTESNASTDDLDTINGLESNDLLFIYAENSARTIRVRDGEGNIFLRHQITSKSYNFNSPTGSSGIFYVAGNYLWSATEAVLNQGATTQTHGNANVSYAAHASVVAAGGGAKSSGNLVITVTGTSIDDNGNRNSSGSEVIVASAINADFAQNAYAETTLKWIGQVTFTLSSSGGGSFNCSFNYGFSKYEDFGNQDFTVTDLECVGRGGAADAGFNIKLYHHSASGWAYAASGFVPGGTVLANMNTDHNTEINVADGHPINYKRANLNTDVGGNNGEGLVLEITTGQNRTIESMDAHIGVHAVPKYFYLGAATQHTLFMKHGNNFHQV